MLRAIAVATDTSDVVGTVDLACEDDGLRLHFVRISAYASEYVPSLATRDARMVVPYKSIREVHDDGETLRLSLAAPRLPHRRLVLAHFTRDLRDDAARVHQRRRRVQGAVAVASAAGAGLLALGARWFSAAPGVVATTLGAFVAVAGGVWLAQEAGRRVMVGGAETMAERRAFFHELTRHLRRVNASAHVLDDAASALGPATAAATGRAADPGASSEGESSALAELYPTLGAIGVAATVAVLAVIGGRSVLGPTDGGQASSSAAGALAVAPDTASAPSTRPLPREEPLGLCMCQGPSSPYLPARMPRLTVLPRVERARLDPQRPSLALEVAVVNNGAEPIRELKGNVEFLLPGPTAGAPPRVRADKGFYYEGPLRGGHAVKWRLSGRGTSYRVQHTHDDSLDDGSLAPADAFAELLGAQTRSVRVHGAMMLARMRDERAAGAVARLREGASEGEQPMLTALARAAAPVYACEIEPTQDDGKTSLSACLMNSSEEEAGPFDAVAQLTPRTPSPDAAPVATTLRRRILIPPRTGVRVQGQIESLDDALLEVVLEPVR